MKTTLDLNDALLAEAKATAARRRTPLTCLIEEGLQLRLQKQRMPAKPVRLPVYRGKGGLMTGLDGLSNKYLLYASDHDACSQYSCRRITQRSSTSRNRDRTSTRLN